MFKKLFLLLLFLIITSPVQAVDLPKGVKPEQGKASGTLGIGDEQLTVSIDFWNVGEIGGGEYGKATIDIGCTQKTIGDWKCTADENPPAVGTFSGGPNGKLIINENTIQLVNGNKFTSDLEKTFQATVENPEIFSKYDWGEDVLVEGPILTIVIPKNFFGGGTEDRRIEVKNGVINTTVPFRFRPSEDFTDAVIKGTYDPESGVLETTLVIAPHEEGAEFLMEFDGTMKADLSTDNTAGFMTMSGNLWQWTEGDDKGPPGDYYQRVYYTVEYPAGQPEPEAETKPVKEPVDSNLRVLIGTGVNLPRSGLFIKRAGSNELIEADKDTHINVGDTIVAPAGGKQVSIYQEGYFEHALTLQPGTNLTISKPAELLSFGEFLYEHVYDPKKGTNEQFDNFEMQLANLKVKLKGTKVVLKEDGETSSIKVIEGAAEATDIKTGKTIEVNAGKMIAATNTGIGELQAFDVNAENDKWKDFTNEIGKTGTNQKNYLYYLGIPIILVATIIAVVLALKKKKRA